MDTRADGVFRNIEADREVGGRRDFELDGIADDDGARGNFDTGTSTERQCAIGAGDDAGSRGADGEVGGADVDGLRAEGVRETNADRIATDADMHDLAECLVVEYQSVSPSP